MPELRSRRRAHARAGFTLVELLVVIGIIALLISILMPALSKAKEQGIRAACANNLRQFAAAVHMYANNHKGFLPFVNADVTGSFERGWLYTLKYVSSPRRQDDVKEGVLYEYLAETRVYHCPGDEAPYTVLGFPNATHPLSSYTMNVCTAERNRQYLPYKIHRFKTEAVMFWEPDGSVTGGSTVWDDGTSAPHQAGITKAHGKRTAVGCVDGHVESYTTEQFNQEAGRAPYNSAALAAPVPNGLWCTPGTTDGGRKTWAGF